MKYGIVLFLLLTLTGCETTYNVAYALFSEKRVRYLTDKEGVPVVDCDGVQIEKREEAPKFWQENQLPRGTTEFVCKDRRAYLPNKAADCQGRLLTSYPNGIMGFKEQHNFPKYPVGTQRAGQLIKRTSFTCQNGQVIPSPSPFTIH